MGFIALLAGLSACVSVERSFPEKRFYLLDVSRPETAAASSRGPLLRVRKLRVSPRYEGKGFVYRLGDLRYESDFYNEFLIAPGPLLTEEVYQWLVGSGLFQHVTDTTSPLELTYILEGTVSVLYGDYRNRASSAAALRMQFALVRDVSARTEIVFQKQYAKKVGIREASSEALVNGWNEALRQILKALESDLSKINFKKGPDPR